jgi:hypothetical protein
MKGFTTMKRFAFVLLLLFVGVGLFAQQSLNMSATTPSGASNLSAVPVGTAGSSAACYWIVSNFAGGGQVITGPIVPTNLNGTLSGSNYETLTWTAPPLGFGITYDVLKTTAGTPPIPSTCTAPTQGGSESLTTGLSTLTYNDQGGGLSAYTLKGFPLQGATGSFRLNNWDFASPFVEPIIPGAAAFTSLGSEPDGGAGVEAHGTATNIPLELKGKGTGPLEFNGNEITDPTGAALNQVYSVEGSISIANVNAGYVLVPAVTGRTLKIVRAVVEAVGGNVTACTDVRISDTATSPVDVTITLIANLVSGTFLDETYSTLGLQAANFGVPLTANKGIQIRKTGSSSCATATSVFVIVMYKINS